jgi:hypothetical protein
MEGFPRRLFPLAVRHGVPTAIYTPPHMILGKGFRRSREFRCSLDTRGEMDRKKES